VSGIGSLPAAAIVVRSAPNILGDGTDIRGGQGECHQSAIACRDFPAAPQGFFACLLDRPDARAVAQTAAASPMTASPADPAAMTITGSNQLVDPGAGNHTIQFLACASADTLVLHTGGVDQVSGFDPATDVLALHSLLTRTGFNLIGDLSSLRGYLTVVDQGSDMLLNVRPTAPGGGETVPVLHGLGATITGLDQLIAQGALRMT
jgi:hypothetical protein